MQLGPNNVTINGQGAADLMILRTADGTTTDGPDLVLDRNTVGVNGQFLGRINWRGRNDANGGEDYAVIRAYIADATAGTEDGLLQFMVTKDGTMTEGFRVASGAVEVNATQNQNIDFKVKTAQSNQALLVDGGTGDIVMNGQYGEILRMDSSLSQVELYKAVFKDGGAGTTSSIYDDGFWFHIEADTAGYVSANGFDVCFLNPNNSTGTNGLTYLNRIVTADLTSSDYTVGGGSVQLSGALFKVTNAGTYTGVTLSSTNGYMARIYNSSSTTSITCTPSAGTINNAASITVAPKKMLSAICIGSGASAEWVLI
jgi:hypothetical protein